MKIIKRGDESPKWWVGKQATCSACGSVIEFEDTDEIEEHARTVFGIFTQRFISTPCPIPECEGTVELTLGEATEQETVTRAESV